MSNFISLAAMWEARLESIPKDKDGFRVESQWDSTVKRAMEAAVSFRYWPETDYPSSYDQSIVLVYEDGSEFRIDNPRQAAFCGQAGYSEPV